MNKIDYLIKIIIMPKRAINLAKCHYENLASSHKHLPWLLVLFVFVNVFALSISSILPEGGSSFGVSAVKQAKAEGNDDGTVLLIHSDSTDGSVVFADDSTAGNGGAGHTITAVGNVHHEVDQKKFGATSMYFDGSGDYLSVPDSEDWDFGGGDFTIDFWVRRATVASHAYFYNQYKAGYDGVYLVAYALSHGKKLVFNVDNDGSFPWAISLLSTTTIEAGVWYHVAVSREGNVWRLFVNGVKEAEATNSLVLTDKTSNIGLGIGAWDFSSNPYYGHMDEMRVSKGVARWTS
ncbi:LamG domain-containing protein, partial [Patescibacteria group bacterium]|nr:LamG domain-containing protein [Patescibacteria group bacterium]